MTSELFAVERDPYAIVVPNSTCDEDGWSVTQVIVAEALVTFDTFTAEMTGAGVVVVKLRFEEIARVPPELADMTAKL